MSILIANLKHLYQRPGLWLAYAVFGLLALPSLAIPPERTLAGQGHFMGFTMLEFLIGLCTASLPAEILTKPFSYCLPGHRAAPRNFVSSVAVVTSLLSSFFFVAYPNLYGWQWLTVTCSAFCAGLTMYWIGAALAFGLRNSSSGLAVAVWLVLGMTLFDLHIIAERTIIIYPFVIVLLGLASSAMVWIWLGNQNWARRLCASPRVGIFDIWNGDRLLEFKRRREAVKLDRSKYNLDPWVERFFVRRMNRCDHLGPGRYIWGGLYTTYGMAISRWKRILSWLLWALAIVVFLSYLEHGATDILFLMAGVMVIHLRLPVHSAMTISGGRSERFVTTVILAGTFTVLISATLIFVALLSVPLALIMPEITFRGALLTFHTMSFRLLIVPSIMIPIVLALQLIICRKPLTTFLAVAVPSTLIFVLVFCSLKRIHVLINPVSLVSLLMLSWLVLVIVLRNICMRRSLVGQSRTY